MNEVNVQRKFFDDLSQEWDQICNDNDNELKVEHIIKSSLLPLKGPILDVGSGTGILLPPLRKLTNTAICALDISHKMLKVASDKHKNIKHRYFLQTDAHHIPFISNVFGTIICFCVYPHFHNPSVALNELYRVQKEEGRLVILHLMCHKKLNAMHASKNEVVASDILPPSGELANEITDVGYKIEQCKEHKNLYLIIGRK